MTRTKAVKGMLTCECSSHAMYDGKVLLVFDLPLYDSSTSNLAMSRLHENCGGWSTRTGEKDLGNEA